MCFFIYINKSNGLVEQWGYSTKAGNANPVNYYITLNSIISKSFSTKYYGVNEYFGITDAGLTSKTQIVLESNVSTSRSWFWSTVGY